MWKLLPPVSLFALSFLFSYFVQARPSSASNDNIVLTSSVETYRYEYIKAKGSVVIKGEIVNKYTCRNYRDKGQFFSFFDDQTTLESVELYENGSKSYAPATLKDYSIEDVFYSDAKVFNLDLSFPKSGWQNEVRLKKIITDPRYFCNVFFPEPYAVAEKQITVVIPTWMKAMVKEFNFDGYEVGRQHRFSEKENADVYTYTIKNLPARKSEIRQPGSTYVWPHLLMVNQSAAVDGQAFTFFNTLADQYGWYKKILSLCHNDAPIIKPKALEITAGAKTDMEKVKAVLYWVYGNIRYVAFEDGIAGFKPDEAQHVLNKKYGDCKGMANLTKELLKALGFDARLAWIGTNHIRYDYSTPSLCVDNHMICCLVYKNKNYFLDGTERYLPFEEYAERIQGRQVLVENGDGYWLEKIPVTTAAQNLCQFKETLRIKDNALEGDVEYLYRGESKQHLLNSIHSSKKEKQEVLLERYITNDNQGYLISGVQTSDLQAIDGDLHIRFGAKNSGAISAFGNEMYIDIDYNKTFNQFLFDSSRKFDYCFSYKHHYRTETTLQLPGGYSVASLPKNIEVKHPDFSIVVMYTTENNTVLYKKELQIHTATLKKASFEAWNEAVAQLSSRYLDQIILTKN